MKDEVTTKYKLDISDFKKNITEANKAMKLSNAEFKAASAGMDDWRQSSEGLEAKLKQLHAALSAQKSKLENYQGQLRAVEVAQRENSRRAEEAKEKYQQAARQYGENSEEAKKYKNALNQIVKEEISNGKAADKLRISVLNQQAAFKNTEKEIRGYTQELKDLKDGSNKAEEATEKMKEGFTIVKGAIASFVADGIRAAIEGMKELALESEDAMDKFQASTGLSTDEMKKFKDEILELYKNNYGESVEDIAESMAKVKQVTGETDPSKLKEMTKYAINLRDTFGSDFDESIRGINNLMYQYGISSEEAFNLFAKGSQEGLDYTNELGDNVAEYSGNFKQAGYSAGEYFQLLDNGTSNGAYNLDKVNDAINEATNKLADGSIEKNLKIFSSGTQKVFKEWQNGGATQKDVIDSVVKDINNCKNEQDALTMAATLFGTMGEDSNLDFIKSLTSVGDTFNDVKGTMESVDQTRWDNTKAQLTVIKRGLEVDILQPILNAVVPALAKFGGWFISNTPMIVGSLAAIGTGFLIFNIGSVIATVTSAIGTLTTAIGLLGITISANPIGAFAALIGAVAVGGITAYTMATSKASDSTSKMKAEQDKLSESINKNHKAYQELESQRKEQTTSVNQEFAQTQNLANELTKIVDKNGKVKKGYEDRANVIAGLLSQALGTEIEITNGVIQNYDKLRNSINKVIATKKAEAMMDANKDAYTKAVQNQTKAFTDLQKAQSNVNKADAEHDQAKQKAKQAQDDYNEAVRKGSVNLEDYRNKKLIAEAQERSTNTALKEQKKELGKAQSTYSGYMSTIQNYEGVMAAVASGDVGKMNVAVSQLANNFKTSGIATKTELKDQVTTYRNTYNEMRKALEQGAPGVTKAQVEEAKKLVTAAEKEYNKLPGKVKNATKKTASESTKPLKSSINEFGILGATGGETFSKALGKTSKDSKKNGKSIGNASVSGAKTGSKGMKSAGASGGKYFQSSLAKYKSPLLKTGTGLGKSGVSGAKSGSKGMKTAGSSAGNQFGKGITSKYDDSSKKGTSLAKKAKKGSESVKTTTSGENFSKGFINGIGNKLGDAWDAAVKLAKKAWAGLKAGQKEGSPSKLTTQSGKYFGQGFVNGIVALGKAAVKAATDLGNDTTGALDTSLDNHSLSKKTKKSGSYFAQGLKLGITKAGKAAIKAAGKLGSSSIKALTKTMSGEEKTIVSVMKDQISNVVKIAKNYTAGKFTEAGTAAGEAFSTAIQRSMQTSQKKVSYLFEQQNQKYDKQLTDLENKKKNDKNIKKLDSLKKKELAALKKETKYEKASKKSRKKMVKDVEEKYKKKRKKLTKPYDDAIKDLKKKQTAFTTASEETLSAFTEGMSEFASKAEQLVSDTISGITDTYQAKWDELESLQESIITKLKGFGELFTVSSAGVMTINDIKKQTDDIKAYMGNLNNIKGKVSEELFEQIASYDVEQGKAFMDQLLNMSDQELKAYDNAYTEKMRLSEQLTKNMFQTDFAQIGKEYQSAIDKAFKDMKPKLEQLGKECMQGFISGLKGDTSFLSGQIQNITNNIVDAFKDDLKIHSPSKIFENLGIFSIQGYVNGFVDKMAQLKKSMIQSIPIKEIGKITGKIPAASVEQIKGAKGSAEGKVINQTFNQYNNSPKPLNRFEVWRQTNNLLAYSKA